MLSGTDRNLPNTHVPKVSPNRHMVADVDPQTESQIAHGVSLLRVLFDSLSVRACSRKIADFCSLGRMATNTRRKAAYATSYGYFETN